MFAWEKYLYDKMVVASEVPILSIETKGDFVTKNFFSTQNIFLWNGFIPYPSHT
jgi:hypothetical protein